MTEREWEQRHLEAWWRDCTPRETWRQVYGLMRFAKGCSNVGRFNLAETARCISPRVCRMAYWAAMLVNGKYGLRAM